MEQSRNRFQWDHDFLEYRCGESRKTPKLHEMIYNNGYKTEHDEIAKSGT